MSSKGPILTSDIDLLLKITTIYGWASHQYRIQIMEMFEYF